MRKKERTSNRLIIELRVSQFPAALITDAKRVPFQTFRTPPEQIFGATAFKKERMPKGKASPATKWQMRPFN